jgi:hypothetical protein
MNDRNKGHDETKKWFIELYFEKHLNFSELMLLMPKLVSGGHSRRFLPSVNRQCLHELQEIIYAHTSQQPHSSPHGTTRPQATETTSAHRSAHQI